MAVCPIVRKFLHASFSRLCCETKFHRCHRYAMRYVAYSPMLIRWAVEPASAARPALKRLTACARLVQLLVAKVCFLSVLTKESRHDGPECSYSFLIRTRPGQDVAVGGAVSNRVRDLRRRSI